MAGQYWSSTVKTSTLKKKVKSPKMVDAKRRQSITKRVERRVKSSG